MNAVTQIEDHEVARLFEAFELGTLQSLQLAANGIENSNYFVTVRVSSPGTDADGATTAETMPVQRRYVLTLLEQASNAGSRAYLDLIDNAVRAGLPVPALMRHPASGAAYDQLYGKATLIARRLDGQHVLNPTRDQIAAIARFLARFHSDTAHLASYLPAYPRNPAWLRTQLDTIRCHVPYADYDLAAFAATAVSRLLARSDLKALPRCVIHGDLFRDNALFNDRGLSGVLDFHHAATGHALFDLAVVANDWCTDSGGALNRDRCLTLLRSYHQLRPLQLTELWHFSAYTLYAALVFYLSRASARVLAQQQAGSPPARTKNPEEYCNILRERLARPITLDARALGVARL